MIISVGNPPPRSEARRLCPVGKLARPHWKQTAPAAARSRLSATASVGGSRIRARQLQSADPTSAPDSTSRRISCPRPAPSTPSSAPTNAKSLRPTFPSCPEARRLHPAGALARPRPKQATPAAACSQPTSTFSTSTPAKKPPPNFAKLPGGLEATDGVIDHGYPEDGKTIFQDIGASKAPQSDCPAAPAGSPSDCSARPAAGCRLHQLAGCRLPPDSTPPRHRRDGRTRALFTCHPSHHV